MVAKTLADRYPKLDLQGAKHLVVSNSIISFRVCVLVKAVGSTGFRDFD